MIEGIDFTSIKVCCTLVNGEEIYADLLLSTPDELSTAEIIFQSLACLNFIQRQQLTKIEATSSCYEEIPFFITETCEFIFTPSWDEFQTFSEENPQTKDICPECGIDMAKGLNPLCEDVNGCGGKRLITDSTPYEEVRKEVDG